MSSEILDHPSAIAVIAMAGRFPGARSVDEFRQNLADGVESITFLSDAELRQRGVAAQLLQDPRYVRAAAPLADVDGFDAQFFKYSARDAEILDPQHRLFLECAWEALEAAGYAEESESTGRRRAIGVFAGAGPVTASYLLANVHTGAKNAPPETRVAVNNDKDYIATRVSYKLNLRGPSLTVQTACSTSLVAVHLACQSLLSGECDLALAGGASIRFPHAVGYQYQEGEMYSPDGHCRAFDQRGQGTLFGSGVGVVLLKPLAAALADGDEIEAVIRGSAISNDGGDKISFWATSADGQIDAMAAALAVAEVPPDTIRYVEAHGTATELGDPVEMFALNKAYRMGAEQVCAIGSVKSNIGHTESAAGVIGLIKAVLSLKHQQIYPSLHFQTPNPRIDFASSAFYVNTALRHWPAAAFPRRAAVNSLGIGGTNAHVVLEEAPPGPRPAAAEQAAEKKARRSHELLVLSAKTPAALQELAQRYHDHLRRHPDQALADVCYTASTRRAHFECRLALVAETVADALAQLPQAAAEPLRTGQPAPGQRPRVVFLFTGQGAQSVNMGRALYQSEPVFRAALDRCAALLRPHLEAPLFEVLYPDEERAAGARAILAQTVYTQPALFAVEYALTRLWESWGVLPDVVMGHSVGELVAACVAGVFTLEDAIKLVAARGRLMQALPQTGMMAAVWASEDAVRAALAPYEDTVAIAGYNGPQHLTISGERSAVQAVMKELAAQAIQTRELEVSHAFHSPLMEPMLAEYAALARTLAFAPPRLALISTVTGERAKSAVATPEYWTHQVRQPVRFSAGVQTLQADGPSVFVEVGPSPVLLGLARSTLEADGASGHALLPSMRAGAADRQVILRSLGELYVRGAQISWKKVAAGEQHRRVRLPTYPFQRTRYHMAPAAAAAPESGVVRSGRAAASVHPLLGHRLPSPLRAIQFESQVSATDPAYLSQHQLGGSSVFPASGYYEMGLAAGQLAAFGEPVELAAVRLPKALLLAANQPLTLQCIVTPAGSQFEFQIYSLPAQDSEMGGSGATAQQDALAWTLNATGVIKRSGQSSRPEPEANDSQPWASQDASGWTALDAVRSAREQALAASAVPRPRLEELWQKDSSLRGRFHVPDELLTPASYRLHPQILTACLELLPVLVEDDASRPYVQVGVDALRLYARPARELWFTLEVHPADAEAGAARRTADLHIQGPGGKALATLTGVTMQQVERAAVLGEAEWKSWLYDLQWLPAARFGAPGNQVFGAADFLRTVRDEALRHDKLVAEGDGAASPQPAQRAAYAYLDRLAVAYIHAALTQLGWLPGQRLTADQLITKLQISRVHGRLFVRLLHILDAAGRVRQEGDGWRLDAAAASDPQRLQGEAAGQDALVGAELALLTRCGANLAKVLSGQLDPLELLFPGGDLKMAMRVYRESQIIRRVHTLAQQVMAAIQAQPPARQGLRILEVGAGTGGMTTYLLPHLGAERTQYVFTDIGSAFLLRAAAQLKDYPFVQYKSLDIEKAPAAQGFAGQKYDVVIAANVLHATQDLRTTLANVQSLLAPGGIVIMVEVTTRQPWIDLVFGLTEGWWRFTDADLRPDYPLVSAQKWCDLLTAQGFAAAMEVAADDEAGTESAAVVIAQAPAAALDVVAPSAGQLPAGRRWLLFTSAGRAGETLGAELRSRGERCTLVYRGSAYARDGAGAVCMTDSAADFQRLLSEEGPLAGVVHEWAAPVTAAMTADELDQAITVGSRSALHLTQALLSLAAPPPLWLVTHGGHVLPAEQTPNGDPGPLAAGPLWGLGRSIALEHPELRCTLVDLQPGAADAAACLVEEVLQPSAESQLLFRNGQRYVARLQRTAPTTQTPLSIRASSTYLITGGLGGLGLATAQWLVAQGARHLVLVGRRAADAATRAALGELEAAGAQLVTAQADVAEPAQLARILTDIQASMPPLRGIIHAAGTFADRLIQNHDWDSFTHAFRPKVRGAWNLHCLTRALPLDFFVLYSAGAALLGDRGLSNYIAANSFLDGLAHFRRQQGLPALSIDWGPWRQLGMAAAVDSQRVGQWKSAGITQMEPAAALAALAALMQSGCVQVGVIPIHWPTFLASLIDSRHRLFFATLASANEPQALPAAKEERSFREQLAATAGPLQHQRLTAHVQQQLAAVLRIAEPQLTDWHSGFTDMGLDSLLAMELRNRLQVSLACRLPATLTFKYPRLDSLITYLASDVLHLPPPARQPAVPVPAEAATPGGLAAEVGRLSAAEVDASLAAELAELEALLQSDSV